MATASSPTVLFAEASEAAARVDASRNAVAAAVINVADSTGGLVIRRVGGRVMMLFATPDAAASAASKIHATVEALPSVGGTKLGVHVGFQAGPVVQSDPASIDRTAKLALRLAAQAEDGQTLTSKETAELLNPAFRSFSRCHHLLGADSHQTWLFEVASWHKSGVRPAGWSAMAVLRLTLRERLLVCSREKDAIVLGRDGDCDFVVDSRAASRRHCTIRHVDGEFVLRDHSSNGTYVTVGGAIETTVNEREFKLPDEGLISLGVPRAESADVVQFCFALVT